MPPLTVAGCSFLLSPDDLVFAAGPSVLIHLLWVVVDTSRVVQRACRELDVDPAFLIADACLCAAVTLLDVGIAVLSAQGKIMEARRHPKLLKFLLWPRLLLSLPLFAIYTHLACYAFFDFLGDHFGVRDPLGAAKLEGWSWKPGWGPAPAGFWPILFAEILILIRLLIVVLGALCLVALLIPQHTYSKVSLSAIGLALRFVGVNDTMLEGIIKVLLDLMGQDTLSVATPSDLAFGLLLVATKQRQGLLGWQAVKDGELSSSVLRASKLRGVRCEPVPLNPRCKADQEALQRIVHFVPYAIGIYGVGMDVFSRSVYHMSSLPSPLRFLKAVCRALPCRQKAWPRSASVYGDLCCRLNEHAFRRVLAAGAKRGGTLEPELLWVTWKNRGPGTSPPLAVLLDYTRRCLVITVRGTLDVKDCMSDLGAHPAFFDPLDLAGPDDAREEPFDDSTGLYAHSTIISCARDALRLLFEAGVVEGALAPGGRAHGWSVVCTGHSLGAGVACILALLLRKPLPGVNVTCVCFEPPGGLLSKRLAEAAGELGTLSAVCANDWITRLSLRTLQDLREQLLDELEGCQRSKLQLTWLIAAKALQHYVPARLSPRPLVRVFEWLGGGALELSESRGEEATNRRGFSSVRHRLRGSLPAASFFSELWPPARIVYFRPSAEEWWLCGLYEVVTQWTAEWVLPEDLHELIISPRSVELHFPSVFKNAYRSAAVALESVDCSDGASTDRSSGWGGNWSESPSESSE